MLSPSPTHPTFPPCPPSPSLPHNGCCAAGKDWEAAILYNCSTVPATGKDREKEEEALGTPPLLQEGKGRNVEQLFWPVQSRYPTDSQLHGSEEEIWVSLIRGHFVLSQVLSNNSILERGEKKQGMLMESKEWCSDLKQNPEEQYC